MDRQTNSARMGFLRLDFATPSQNVYTRWHWTEKREHLIACRQHLKLALLRSPGLHIPLWPELYTRKEQKIAPCAYPGCNCPPAHTDRRGNRWCDTHFDTRKPGAKRSTTIRRYSSGRLDRGNFIGGAKALVDSLVYAGVLYDDTEQWLDDSYEQCPGTPRKGWTEIEVRWGAEPAHLG